MSHQAIYRKFRPIDFESIVGQNHITETIKKQINKNSIAHAYIFSGIRGTGKTSTAKIFARAVNCLNPQDGNPCNKCEICVSTLKDANIDVVEMDAASNNSVEDIRDLREKVKFLPSKSKFKVYIIDEVHMLSKGAFNALLKTLEEPPSHLLFILATTEPEKIPATILSRCQRFDFKRLRVKDMMENMNYICSEIGIEADDKALRLIANSAEGAMRDALSILDRCLNIEDKKITYESVIELLGTVNYSILIDFTDKIIGKDVAELMFGLEDILSEGKEITQFLKDLIEHFRNMLIVKASSEGEKYLNLGEDTAKDIRAQSDNLEEDTIIKYIEELSETLALCKKSLNERVLLETRLIKMIRQSSNYYKSSNDVRISQPMESSKKAEKINREKKTTQSSRKKEVKDSLNEKKEESPNDKTNNYSNLNLKYILDSWDNILNEIKKEKVSFHAIIKEATPLEIKENKITFGFKPNYKFHYDQANKKENLEYFTAIVNSKLGANFKVEFSFEKDKKKLKNDEEQYDIIEKVEKFFDQEIKEIVE